MISLPIVSRGVAPGYYISRLQREGARCAGGANLVFSYLPSPFGRRAGDEGLANEIYFPISVFHGRRVAFKDKNI
jgi:hypothetical protein